MAQTITGNAERVAVAVDKTADNSIPQGAAAHLNIDKTTGRLMVDALTASSADLTIIQGKQDTSNGLLTSQVADTALVNTATGTPADSKATDSTSSWSIIALLKGIYANGGGGGGGASAAYNATLPTYTSGASTVLQTDANGRLITAPLTSIPLATAAAQDGTDGTGIPAPTGGSGIRGWLSGIYSKISTLVSSGISVSNFPSSQAVTGTFWQATQPVSVADGSDATQGSKADTAWTSGSGSVISILKAAVNAINASLPAGSNTIGSVNVLGGNVTAVKVDGSAVTQPVSGTVGISSTVPVSGTFWQATQPISASSLPLPTGASQDGTDGTGITAPTGGSGIRGWLSGIYSKLSNALTVTISGTPTVTVGNSSIPVTGTFYQATQPVSGTVSVNLNGGSNTVGAVLTAAGSITMTNSSVGASSATLLAASSATKLLVVQNTSANILYVSTTSPATATNGIVLAAGQGYEFPYVPSNALYALGSAASTTYTLLYA